MAKCSKQQLTNKDLSVKSKARFNFKLDDSDFEESTRGYLPPNTMYDMRKCVELFTDWTSVKNACFPETPVPDSTISIQPKCLSTMISVEWI